MGLWWHEPVNPVMNRFSCLRQKKAENGKKNRISWRHEPVYVVMFHLVKVTSYDNDSFLIYGTTQAYDLVTI